MTISVLDRTDGTADASLGGLHDAAGAVDDEQLPCRVNNPELWFAESPPTWSSPRRCAWTAQSGPCASTALSSGASPGASGAVSSSCREW